MPTELDVYAPERWVDDALFRPEVREAYRRLVAQGWTDALRALHPGERIYTFWKYFRNAFARDAALSTRSDDDLRQGLSFCIASASDGACLSSPLAICNFGRSLREKPSSAQPRAVTVSGVIGAS